MTFKPYLAFALLVFGLGSLRAQDKPPGPFFRTYGVNITSEKDLFYSKDGNDIPITLMNEGRSLLLDANVPSPIVFYKIQNGPDGKPAHFNVGQADISKTGNLTMLFFSPNPAVPGTFQIQAVPDDLTMFPLGSYEVTNLASRPVKAVFDKTSEVVRPHEAIVSRPELLHPTYVTTEVDVDGTNGPTVAYADTWAHRPNVRTTVLAYENRDGILQIKRLTENPAHLLDKGNLPKDGLTQN